MYIYRLCDGTMVVVRYSEHKRNHWFHSERDGLSYVGKPTIIRFGASSPRPHHLAPNQRGEQTEKSDSIPQLQPYKELKEPVFCEVTQVKRRKRSKQGAPSVEKVILKGTIDKIWAPTAAISILPRHLFQT